MDLDDAEGQAEPHLQPELPPASVATVEDGVVDFPDVVLLVRRRLSAFRADPVCLVSWEGAGCRRRKRAVKCGRFGSGVEELGGLEALRAAVDCDVVVSIRNNIVWERSKTY
jgi:hypothetical protein